MLGYRVPRKAADTHGLLVEVEVEKELPIHGKAAIEEYGVEPFIQRCIQSVFRYTREWEEITERVGFWVDLADAYVTYHRSYVESVWWALSKLFEKGLLYQGHKVVWWWAQGARRSARGGRRSSNAARGPGTRVNRTPRSPERPRPGRPRSRPVKSVEVARLQVQHLEGLEHAALLPRPPDCPSRKVRPAGNHPRRRLERDMRVLRRPDDGEEGSQVHAEVLARDGAYRDCLRPCRDDIGRTAGPAERGRRQ